MTQHDIPANLHVTYSVPAVLHAFPEANRFLETRNPCSTTHKVVPSHLSHVQQPY